MMKIIKYNAVGFISDSMVISAVCTASRSKEIDLFFMSQLVICVPLFPPLLCVYIVLAAMNFVQIIRRLHNYIN